MSSTLRFIRSLNFLASVFVLGLSFLALPAFAAYNGCEDRVNTQEFRFTVTLPDNNTYDVAGTMYWQGQLNGKILQIAVHGASYNHKYWDADDLNGHPYSYARYMACHGFAVLAMDNLGAGASSKPDGDFVTISVEAMALHQIIQGLEAAPVATSFRKIVLVGHSMGAEQVITAQAMYNDADGVIVTGWVSTPHQVPLPEEIFGSMFEESYVSLPPWMRTVVFYGGDFDPAMPDYDNQNLFDQVPRGVFNYPRASAPGLDLSVTTAVQAPVFLVFSELDMVMPASLAASDAAMFTNAASVTTRVVYNTGHDLNLHLTNVAAWAEMKEWIRQNVGGSGAND